MRVLWPETGLPRSPRFALAVALLNLQLFAYRLLEATSCSRFVYLFRVGAGAPSLSPPILTCPVHNNHKPLCEPSEQGPSVELVGGTSASSKLRCQYLGFD